MRDPKAYRRTKRRLGWRSERRKEINRRNEKGENQ
jgi:hypothetical protein